MTNPIITIGFGQGQQFFATLGYFAAKNAVAAPRPPTTIKDVFRGTVAVSGSVQRMVTLGGSAGGG